MYAEHPQSEGSGVRVIPNRQLSVFGKLLKGTTAALGKCPSLCSYETTLQFLKTFNHKNLQLMSKIECAGAHTSLTRYA